MGRKQTEETKRKISKALKGNKNGRPFNKGYDSRRYVFTDIDRKNFGKSRKSNYRKSALEYLNSTCVKPYILKIKLLEDRIKQYKCEECNLELWNNKKIPLEIHHIDFNSSNNNLSNIKLICPNCHAQKENNSGRAVKLKRLASS